MILIFPLLTLLGATLTAAPPPTVFVAPVDPTRSTAAQPAKPDPEALAAALELEEPEELKRALATALRLTLTALDNDRKGRERRGQKIPDALYEKLKAFVVEDMTTTYDKLGPTLQLRTAAIYAKYFTAAELRELKLLHAQPVMRKMKQISPTMAVEIAEIGMREVAARAPEQRRKLQQIIDEWMAKKRLQADPKSGT
jgi:hypothetical protein